jgi:hypothetical protein
MGVFLACVVYLLLLLVIYTVLDMRERHHARRDPGARQRRDWKD